MGQSIPSQDTRDHDNCDEDGDSDVSDCDENMSADKAADKFIDGMTLLYMSGQLPAVTFSRLMAWAGLAGISKCKKYGLLSKYSGNHERHCNRIFGFKHTDEQAYPLNVLTSNSRTLVRETYEMPVIPPHEPLFSDVDAETSRLLHAHIDEEKLPPCYHNHPVVESAPENVDVYPIAMYIDGLPYSQTDSVVGVWIINIITQKRTLCVTLRKNFIAGAVVVGGVPCLRCSNSWPGALKQRLLVHILHACMTTHSFRKVGV